MGFAEKALLASLEAQLSALKRQADNPGLDDETRTRMTENRDYVQAQIDVLEAGGSGSRERPAAGKLGRRSECSRRRSRQRRRRGERRCQTRASPKGCPGDRHEIDTDDDAALAGRRTYRVCCRISRCSRADLGPRRKPGSRGHRHRHRLRSLDRGRRLDASPG